MAQAVRGAARAYVDEPGLDVEERLRLELTQQGAALQDASVLALARAVRAGRSEELLAHAADSDDHHAT